MKFFLFISLFLGALAACKDKSDSTTTGDVDSKMNSSTPSKNKLESATLVKLFTKADAEQILGGPVTISDSTMSAQMNIEAYKSAYSLVSNPESVVHFLVESYSHVADATTKYSFIKASNEGKPGFEEYKGVKDEGYFHSDGTNFAFTMIRKGANVASIKVNKMTSTTSKDQVQLTAKRIAESL
jgi:hypothetical protein